MIAIVFEFTMRMLRVHISEVVQKHAYLRISEVECCLHDWIFFTLLTQD